mmetsp:Transcript_31102/g.71066  ORF Transcript_31102/g.71066 Transcript_31102/m.71066 type:complete len:153 (-) Transcript_31102:12-470(-)
MQTIAASMSGSMAFFRSHEGSSRKSSSRGRALTLSANRPHGADWVTLQHKEMTRQEGEVTSAIVVTDGRSYDKATYIQRDKTLKSPTKSVTVVLDYAGVGKRCSPQRALPPGPEEDKAHAASLEAFMRIAALYPDAFINEVSRKRGKCVISL